ncbi:unnamed protein product [Orchesella dallaii]
MVPGPPGSVETDEMTDDNLLDSNFTTDNENETELMFNEDDDDVILLHEDEEQSSASSGSNDPSIIKKKDAPAVVNRDQRSATVLSPEGGTAARRRQRTLSSNGALLGSSSRRHDGILRTLTRTIYTAGRPPWYDAQGQHVEPCVIGICGGSASGKTTVADKIIQELNVPWVTRLSMDCFYKNFTAEDKAMAGRNEFNFDHPDAFDFDALLEVLHRLRDGKKAEVPVYNFVTHSREVNSKTMYGANVIIFEGIFTFHNQEVLKLLDVKVFVDTDADTRLARRLRRDISERGRDLDGCLKQYNKFVKPAFDTYIAPQMAHADIIVPRGGDNEVAINLIVQHVHSQLQARGLKVREKLAEGWCKELLQTAADPDSLFVLPTTNQILGLHTFIRCSDTPRDEFIFYSKRLIRLLIEYALSLLPFQDVVVDTPQNVLYKGKRAKVTKICGVSILRAGETMEQALNEVCKDIRIGKILIQTNTDTGEPELYYLRLPRDIADYHIFLMDATVATGAASMMAIRILLDHDVPEENITLLSLLMAQSGVHSIAYAFPRVKLVTTAVDPEINEKFHVMPGIGNFGDRYFGTEPCDCDIVATY